MTRLSQGRASIPLLFFVSFLGASTIHAQGGESGDGIRLQDAQPAMAITGKTYDEETGDLHLILQNTSDLTVTAFAVALVSASSAGRGATRVRGEEMFPGDGIAPGASYNLTIKLGPPGHSPERYVARTVRLDHEIRSDNSSWGNRSSIDRVFESRAAYLVELEAVLARLRTGRGTGGVPVSALPAIAGEADRGREAQSSLTNPHDRHTQLEAARLAAVATIGGMAEQTIQGIQRGQIAEQAVADLELFFERELENASRNVRPRDLERFER